jgi:hypothetical protein
VLHIYESKLPLTWILFSQGCFSHTSQKYCYRHWSYSARHCCNPNILTIHAIISITITATGLQHESAPLVALLLLLGIHSVIIITAQVPEVMVSMPALVTSRAKHNTQDTRPA